MNMENTILQIPLEDIIPNRFQPRLNFDDEALQELAKSIKEHGIIQPLVLRKLGDKYEIIAGERRYKASQIAGLTTVPAVISNIDDEKSAEVALVENLQRKNLTSIEEAKSYRNILDRGYLTQEQLAEKLGISQSTIANKLRLLNLCDEVQDALLKEKISERHARALLAVKDPTEQIKWLNKIINDRLTVRQLDIEIKKAQKTDPNDDDESAIPLVELTPNIDDIKENALDIHPQEGLHDIEKMLKPSMSNEKSFDLSNPIDEIETLDIDDDESIDLNNSNDSKQLTDDNTPPNKFFNFLEDEAANMSEESSIDDFSNNTYPTTFVEDSVDENENNQYPGTNELNSDTFNNEITNANNQYDSSNEFSNDIVTNDTSNDNNNYDFSNNGEAPDFSFGLSDENDTSTNDYDSTNDATEDDNIQLNSGGRFFNPVDSNETDNSVDSQDNEIVKGNFFNFDDSDSDNNISKENNNNNFEETNDFNTIEPINTHENVIEVKEAPKEDVFDPMSMVNTLEPDYEEKVEEEQGIDLTTAISKVRETRDLLESMGFNVTLEEADTGDVYNLNMNIIK